jgi:phenylpropionate dioxygenase-like ring-hydroxylating dioxygenase large terminal subunit
MNSTEPTWSAADQEAGLTLPARFFYDAQVFEQEKHKIFFKSWHLAAHVNELRQPGQYVTIEIFEQSVLVVAGRDGEIRAFHNVCQHRGNRLVEGRRGKAAMLTCGYHAWTYALDGCLRGASHSQDVPGFDKAAHGLKPVKVSLFSSFVFVNLDAAAQPIEAMAPGAEQEIRRFIPDIERLTLIEEVDVPVAANWKVIQENSIEGYHFDHSGPAHKQLVALINFAGYKLTPHGQWWTYTGPPKPGTDTAYGVPLEGATWQTDWFFNFGLWPNATIYAFPYADVVGTFIMNPTGPESSSLRFGYYGVEGRALPDATKACIQWMNKELGPEDIRLNISNQKGLKSMGFDRGRYIIGEGFANRSEHLVRHFHKLCYSAIR